MEIHPFINFNHCFNPSLFPEDLYDGMHPCPMFPRVCGRGETYLEPGAALLHCHVMVGQWTVGRLNIDIDTAMG